jgi:hypothetical protein
METVYLWYVLSALQQRSISEQLKVKDIPQLKVLFVAKKKKLVQLAFSPGTFVPVPLLYSDSACACICCKVILWHSLMTKLPKCAWNTIAF